MTIVSTTTVLCSLSILSTMTCFAQNETRIGDLIWTTQDLNTRYFVNGDPIPFVTNAEDWKEAITRGLPACCYYNFNPFSAGTGGLLYNGFALTDARGLAPYGYRIPSADDWSNLVKNTGGTLESSKHILANGLMSDNSSKLNLGYPGYVSFIGTFTNELSYWWSATRSGSDPESYVCFTVGCFDKKCIPYCTDKEALSFYASGYSIRLCRNVTSLDVLPDCHIEAPKRLTMTEMMKKYGAANKIINGKKEGKWLEAYSVEKFPKWWEGDNDSVTYYSLINYKAGIYSGWAFDFNDNQVKFDSAFYEMGVAFIQESNSYDNSKIEFTKINGKIDGVYRAYYGNGNLRVVSFFRNGLLEGQESFFDEEGFKVSERHYKNNVLDSIAIFYAKNNYRSSACYYTRGIKEGNSETYHKESTQIASQCTYKQGYKHGIEKRYNQQGVLVSTTEYINGLETGLFTEFNTDGSFETTEMVCGRKNGVARKYDSKGRIKMITNYYADFREGKEYSLYANGNIESEVTYVNDKREGKYVRYEQDGKVSSTCEYANDKMNGTYTFYSWTPNGYGDYKEVQYKDDREIPGTEIWHRNSAVGNTDQQDRSLLIVGAILSGVSQGTQSTSPGGNVNQTMQNGIGQIDAVMVRQPQQNPQPSNNTHSSNTTQQAGVINLPPTAATAPNQNQAPIQQPNNSSSGSVQQTPSAPATDGPWVNLSDGWSYRKLANGMYEFYDGIDQVEMIQAVDFNAQVQRHGGVVASNSGSSTGTVSPSSGNTATSGSSNQDCWCTNNCVKVDVRQDPNNSNRIIINYVNLTDHYVCVKACWLKKDGTWDCGITTVPPNSRSSTTDMYNFDPSLRRVLWVANGKWADMQCSFPSEPDPE